MVRKDKDVGGAKVDKRADIKPKIKVGDDANKVRYKDQQDELVEPDRLLLFGRGILRP